VFQPVHAPFVSLHFPGLQSPALEITKETTEEVEVVDTLSAEGDLSRAGSIYFTPDGTADKLDELAS